jgi:hypothetical protein
MTTLELIRGTAGNFYVGFPPSKCARLMATYKFTASLCERNGRRIGPILTEGAGVKRESGGLMITFSAEHTKLVKVEGTYQVVITYKPVSQGNEVQRPAPIKILFRR